MQTFIARSSRTDDAHVSTFVNQETHLDAPLSSSSDIIHEAVEEPQVSIATSCLSRFVLPDKTAHVHEPQKMNARSLC